ncbi:MAG: long-chain fatty acid--CoA ligase, partial [Candidatus Electrothrix sp. GM3_4]|nr:long-chain fatty acid--CoA ligase [Candidatus Electrothrix sp. GM3_4]
PTKDIGQIRPDGRIKIMGRRDHCVNRDGLLVFFADVETSLKGIEAVENAVVISKGESRRGKGMIACCVPAKGGTANESDIRKACIDILPARAVPDQIVILDELPMLPSGKVDRQLLEQAV